jgi:ParB family chromosome partitioning protein
MSKLVLGKGLSALIPTEEQTQSGTATELSGSNYRTVALIDIKPNPVQPRHDFDTEKLNELAVSLKENGLMQPLIVSKKESGYVLVAGERRFRAANMAGLTEVPVVVVEAEDDRRKLELALIENVQREDLNALELAKAYKRLMDDCHLTQNDVAMRVGKSRAAVANTLRLLSLPDSIQQLVRRGDLSEGHARALLAVGNEAQMLEMAQRIVGGTLSVRDTEREAGRTRKRRLIPKRRIPALSEMENYLKQTLGTSVKILPGLKRGRIEIEYYGDDDLERLLELFRKISA